MFLRLILFAVIGYFIYAVFKRLTGGRKPRQASPFQRQRRRRPFDGNAVDADFEELDDKPGND